MRSAGVRYDTCWCSFDVGQTLALTERCCEAIAPDNKNATFIHTGTKVA